MTELAEGARLEIVCAPKEYLGFESLSLRQLTPAPYGAFYTGPGPGTPRRGGRVVECGGLENRFTGNPGDEGSNPSSSASYALYERPRFPGSLTLCALPTKRTVV